MDRLDEFTKMMNALYESSRTIQQYEKKPRQYGTDFQLYMAEMHVLDNVYKCEGITVTEIASLTHRTKSAITQTVNKLSEKGLIEKRRNKDYYKQINLYTTELGKQSCVYHAELDRKNYIANLEELDAYSTEDFKKISELLYLISDKMKLDEL